jgi:hypothetical protein
LNVFVRLPGYQTNQIVFSESSVRVTSTISIEAKKIDSFEKLRDDALMAQLSSLKPNVRQWVKGRTPSTAAEAAELADLFFETKQGKSEKYNRFRFMNDQFHKISV